MPTPREMEVIKARKRECPPEFNDRRFSITTNDRYGNTKTYVGNEASKLLYYGKLEAKRLRKQRRREERLKKQKRRSLILVTRDFMMMVVLITLRVLTPNGSILRAEKRAMVKKTKGADRLTL